MIKRNIILLFATIFLISEPAIADNDTSRSIQMVCGESKVEIICGFKNVKKSEVDDRICHDNKLVFTLKNGKVIQPSVPKTHDATSTPSNMYCQKGNDKKYYVTVEYLSGSTSCNKCLVGEIYNSRGDWLTESVSDLDVSIQKHLKPAYGLSIEGVR